MTKLDRQSLERASAGDPDWLAGARTAGFETFSTLGPPSPKQEQWKYVDLEFSIDDFAPVPAPGKAGGVSVGPGITLVDGHVVGAPESAPGVAVTALSEAIRDGKDLETLYDGIGDVEHDQFSAASRAFSVDGTYVEVEKGRVVDQVITIDVRAESDGGITFPRAVIVAEEGSQASVVVRFTSPDEARALVVPEIDAAVGANATLSVTVVQEWGAGTSAIGRFRSEVERDGQLILAEAGLGGVYSRVDLAVHLVGKGSSAQVIGAYFGDAAQVLDYRYLMHHVGENTTSDMFLKGGVEDEALSIFTGMIRIEETAQRTNAFQTNRNLLLSSEAAAQSVPNLEILANDVKCGHGSTVGPLDEEQRYYLMSRGLDRERADRLQVRGFFEEALARFPEGSIAGPVRDRINAKYLDALIEGRL